MPYVIYISTEKWGGGCSFKCTCRNIHPTYIGGYTAPAVFTGYRFTGPSRLKPNQKEP